jgi:endonuclease/exonuclease/phosphatase family metal-dependent hydrolase
MTRVLRLLALVPLLVLALAGCQHLRLGLGPDLTAPPERGLRVATHNVHYILVNQPTGAWSVADWQARAPSLDAAFKRLDADLVAFQEMESFAGGNSDDENLARSYLLARNPGYAAAAVGDWRRFPSTQPIFYRTQRLRLLEQGWFFFSDTPDVIYSRTFDGSYPAFASWARFEDRETGARLRVLNLHTDYSSAGNRSRSIELVADRMAPWIDAGERVVLLGDLNARLGSSLHARLEAAGLTFLPVQGATYHFNRGINLFGAIDHIGLGPGLTALGPPMVLREKTGARWPSDHYPVVADIAVARD